MNWSTDFSNIPKNKPLIVTLVSDEDPDGKRWVHSAFYGQFYGDDESDEEYDEWYTDNGEGLTDCRVIAWALAEPYCGEVGAVEKSQ